MPPGILSSLSTESVTFGRMPGLNAADAGCAPLAPGELRRVASSWGNGKTEAFRARKGAETLLIQVGDNNSVEKETLVWIQR